MSKIFVLDDDKGMRQIIIKILTPMGHEIVEEDSSKLLYEKLKGSGADLVIVDTSYFSLEGTGVIDEIRKAVPKINILILADFSEKDTALEIAGRYGCAWISKPFKIDEIIEVVAKNVTAKTEEPKPGLPVKKADPAAAVKKFKKINFLWIFAPIAAAAITAAAILVFTRSSPPAVFTVNYSNPSALSYDGKFIWSADWMAESIYKQATGKDFKLIAEYSAAGSGVFNAIGAGEDCMWAASSFDAKIYKLKLSDKIEKLAEFASPGPGPSGIYYDGEFLWTCDYQQGKVYKHNIDAGLNIVASFDTPGPNPNAMTGSKEDLYIIDGKTSVIYRIRKEDFFLTGMFTLPGASYPKGNIACLASDGSNIWFGFDGSNKIYRIAIKSLKKSGTK